MHRETCTKKRGPFNDFSSRKTERIVRMGLISRAGRRRFRRRIFSEFLGYFGLPIRKPEGGIFQTVKQFAVFADTILKNFDSVCDFMA